MFRKAFFWTHLTAGVIAGIIILLMSVTGVLLAFEKQIVAFAERDLRASAATSAGTPLPLSRLVASAANAADSKPSNVTVRSDRQAPLSVAFGRGRTLFVDRYSGAVLGEGATSVRGFFKVNEDLHRWLAMSDDGRARGKAITGAANLAFLFIVLSGLVLWFPRRLNARTLRNAMLFRKDSRGRARDFNWHHVFGIWAFLPLVLIVASATVISYPWATRLVYQAFGSTPPERSQSRSGREAVAADPVALDRLWSVAAAETNRIAPSWQSIGVRLPLPQDGEISVAVDEGTGARPDKRSQLMVDAASLRVIEHKTYVQQSAGQQARSWLRWIHTGEAGGLFGQLVAMLASAAAVMLVWTGIALTLRRFARTFRGAPTPQQLMEEEGNA